VHTTDELLVGLNYTIAVSPIEMTIRVPDSMGPDMKTIFYSRVTLISDPN
jgi:hypothetical protein